MKLIHIDTETTGVDEHQHQIHELAAIVEIDGKVVDVFNHKFSVMVGCIFDPEAVRLCCTSSEEISNRPLSASDAFNLFISFLEKHVNKFDKFDKFHIVGYNVGFDIRFIRSWFKLNNHSFYGSYFYSNHIDVMSLASHTLLSVRHELPNFKLSTVCTVYGIDIINAHTAFDDIKATMVLYHKITE